MWMGGMMIWMAAFWVAVCLGCVWLVRPSLERRPRKGAQALETLDQRFAEGAISFAEYHERKAVLEGGLPLDRASHGPDGSVSEGGAT